MKIPIYQVDAFTDTLFGGNPAAVCPLEDWLTDEQMQKIATENNLSDTAFLVKNGADYDIRWFTPAAEVKLCGHATLAAAHTLFSLGAGDNNNLLFHSQSGPLRVSRRDNLLTLDFPAVPATPVTDIPSALFEGLHIDPAPVFKSAFDYMVVLPSQKIIESLQPDLKILGSIDARGIIATAPGDDADFVSRCFFPRLGIDEDPVTGSAHTTMTPYWSQQLGKIKLKAIQLSKRRGYLDCELAGDRVLISGNAVTYLTGEIYA